MLEQIRSPKDLQGLSRDQLRKLAEEIRSFLIETVSKT
ncbi:MAG: 1-deoxy-D-xylulose-5-phosphate synthase N-terminal domain-containing protein, partial [Aquiluna sp.]